MTNPPDRPAVVDRWHRVIETNDLEALDALVADDAVFLSPRGFHPRRRVKP